MPDWVDQQLRFHEAYLTRRAGADRRRVKVLWWTVAGGRGPDVMGLIGRLWSGRGGRRGRDQQFVAIFDVAEPVGARPFLVVRAVPGSFTAASGRGTATVIGDAWPEGALLIETSWGTVLPAEPPGLPGDDAPSWSEVDAPA